MLISPLTALVIAQANAPIVLEGPSTLELGLIGAGILIVYAVASRAIDRRRARIAGADSANSSVVSAEHAPPVEIGTEQEPSRGAA